MRSFGERHHGARDVERITDGIPGRNHGAYIAAMRSTDLTTNQLSAISQQVAPMRDYLQRLEARMVAQGFGEDDRLRFLVAEAHKALREGGTGAFDDCRRWAGKTPAALEAQTEARPALSTKPR
jgi:hypothetical protein